MRVTLERAAFDKAYDALILNRAFVEFPEYYVAAKPRYWRTLEYFSRLDLPQGARVLDIGGGQMALMVHALFGFDAAVGDVNDRAAEDVKANGLDFLRVDLMAEDFDVDAQYDVIFLLEVIEHLPVPPYVVLRRLRRLLAPGGRVILTTPNGYRLRNVLYMLANKEILGIYRYPEEGEALGHQHEYTLAQMSWQLRTAGFQIEIGEYYNDGWKGASTGARIGHALASLTAPIRHLRNGLVFAARAPEASGA